MRREAYRYQFAASVTFDEVEAALLLAIVSTESLYGESQVRLDAAHCLDSEQMACLKNRIQFWQITV